MKNLMRLFLLLITASSISTAFSAEKMTKKEQEALINKISKEIRRDFWRSGHEHVQSSFQRMTKALLNEHLSPTNNYESHLDDDEVKDIYQCHSQKNCVVYFIVASSEYYSGYGEDAYYITLDITSGTYGYYRHTIYNE